MNKRIRILFVIFCFVCIPNNMCKPTNTSDITSAITQFCLGKERENFCSDEHLTMMINFAALEGKARPITDRKDLENERKKELERQNRLKIENEKEKEKRIEIKKEREKQRQLHLEKQKKIDLLKQMEMERKILALIIENLTGKSRLIFRF